MIEADAYATNGSDRMVFFDSLPSLVINSATVLGDSTSAISPETVSDVKALMKSECDCLQYCWENARAPWVKRPESIAKYLLPSIDAYVKTANATQIGTKLNNNTDLCSLPIPGLASTEGSNKNDRTTADFFLPLIPNVTIQYRCGDNIGNPHCLLLAINLTSW